MEGGGGGGEFTLTKCSNIYISQLHKNLSLFLLSNAYFFMKFSIDVNNKVFKLAQKNFADESHDLMSPGMN